MGGSKKQTIGYAYYMGLHMLLCKGPIDALLAIRAGGRTAWDGTRWQAVNIENGHFKPPFKNDGWIGGLVQGLLWRRTGEKRPVTSSERIVIQAADLFGGKKREGGIAGALDVMMGEKTQGENDYLRRVIGVPQPAYRGVLSCVFRGGMVGAMNPYIKAWSWRVRRNLKGWQNDAPWYPSTCEIDVGNGVLCMNPAHIIYQVLTDTEDGMGYPASTLDDASFRDAAELFKSEGLGTFFKWMESDKIEDFVKQVLDHCNAYLVQDPLTSLFRLIPIRHDYVAEDLLVLTPSNATLESFDRATLEETINEITVTWDDTFSRSKGSLTVQSLANIQAMGGVVEQTKEYAGCPTQAIAQRLAQRDLDISSALLARCRIRTDRIGYRIVPGQVIALEGFSKIGFGRVLVRILKANYGGPDRQYCIFDGAEDVFGLPVNNYIGTQQPGWIEPSTLPIASPNIDAFEAPYRDLAQALGNDRVRALDPAAGYLGAVAQRPTGLSVNFSLFTTQGSAPYQDVGEGDFCATGTLVNPIGKSDTVLNLQDLTSFNAIDTGTVAFLGNHPNAEAVRIDKVEGAVITVARGALDTVPKGWPSGARLWCYDNDLAEDPQEYVAGEVISAKVVTITTGGELDLADAPVDTVTFNQRQARPYPPARMRINAMAWPVDAWDALTATWVHRSRIIQADTIVGTDDASIGPESGTTYTARWYLDGALAQETTGIAGVSDAYTPPAGSGGKTVRITVQSIRDGLASWQAQDHTFIYRAFLTTEAGDHLVTESGDNLILE